jgi:hypothetical protein
VEECHKGNNISLLKSIEHLVIMVDTRLVHCPLTVRDQARPGETETVRVDAHGGDEVQVLSEAMVVICCHISCITVSDFTRGVRIIIPDSTASAILLIRSFNLIRGSGSTPEEI